MRGDFTKKLRKNCPKGPVDSKESNSRGKSAQRGQRIVQLDFKGGAVVLQRETFHEKGSILTDFKGSVVCDFTEKVPRSKDLRISKESPVQLVK